VCGVISLAVLAAPACAGGEESAARPAATQASNATIPAHDEASFDAAIAKARAGDTIQLADGSYPTLEVSGRAYSGRPVRIVGSRNAKLAGILFLNSSNLVLEGVTITPPGGEMARLAVRNGSRGIVIERVLVDGRDENAGAALVTSDDASDVTIRGSELTNCGRGGGCVRLGAKNLRVIQNKFFDCRSCDFIKGGGQGALVQGNTFDLAHNVECRGGPASCPHNNLIHIMGGASWTIVGNRFGAAKAGSGQIYVNPTVRSADNPIRSLLIASNIFTGDTGMGIRIGIGQRSAAPPPGNVRIVNNTILSGRLTSVMLVIPWAQVPEAQRPLVANNIMRKVNPGNCPRGRFVSNLVLQGTPCPGDAIGNPKLDAKSSVPTAESRLVIDRADPRYAPKTDLLGKARRGAPDRGAVEYRGR
jgi:hypothetical protein